MHANYVNFTPPRTYNRFECGDGCGFGQFTGAGFSGAGSGCADFYIDVGDGDDDEAREMNYADMYINPRDVVWAVERRNLRC